MPTLWQEQVNACVFCHRDHKERRKAAAGILAWRLSVHLGFSLGERCLAQDSLLPMKVIGYKLVCHKPARAESEINELVAKGWQPLGGPAIVAAPPHSDQEDEVYQAMVLYEDLKAAT